MLKRIIQATCVVIVLVGGGIGVEYFFNAQKYSTPVSAATTRSVVARSKPMKSMFSSTLSESLNNVIGEWGNLEIAVSVVDLGTGTQYSAGESDVVFRGASTTKLITAAAYLHEVDKGNATLAERIDGVTASQLLKRMIEDSDNDAWTSVINYLGNKEQDFAKTVGLASYTQYPNRTITSSDMAKLLTLLYQDKLISTKSKEFLLDCMSSANHTDLIKSALPSGATVYHKYGTLYGNLHDTTIVTYEGHSFVLVVFTKNPDNTTNDYTERVELIHQITQAVLGNLKT